MVLRGSTADCMIQIEDLRMSLRLLAERQIGRALLIDLTAEEEPVVGNEESVVPVPVPAPFVLPIITPEHVLVPVDKLVDSDEETVVEGALDTGGKGTWKPVITSWEHCEDWFTILRLFLLRAF